MVIRNNRLNYTLRQASTAGGAFTAITAEGANLFGASRPLVVIDGNVIHSEVVQPAGTRAISLLAYDFNGTPIHHVTGNTVMLDTDEGPAPIHAAYSGANAGQTAHFVFEGNMLNGQIQTTNAGAATPATFKAINCYDEVGAPVGLTDLDP